MCADNRSKNINQRYKDFHGFSRRMCKAGGSGLINYILERKEQQWPEFWRSLKMHEFVSVIIIKPVKDTMWHCHVELVNYRFHLIFPLQDLWQR